MNKGELTNATAIIRASLLLLKPTGALVNIVPLPGLLSPETASRIQ